MTTDTHEVDHMPPTQDTTGRIPAPRRAKRPAAPVTPAPATTAMDLLRIITEKGADAEQIGKFMDLIQRQQDREAQQAYIQAMVAFKKDAPTIYKNEKGIIGEPGLEREFDFATLGHICENIITVLATHGISHDWNVQQPGDGPDAGFIVVDCTLTHEKGGSKSATVKFPADPTGGKNPLQSIGSAITYGERYSLLAVCGIAVKSQPDDDSKAAGAALADNRRSGDGRESGNREQKSAIDAITLRRALDAIKRHDYTFTDLVDDYELTQAQMALATSELNMKGEQQ
jgi:hypothetical protein